MPVCVNLCLWMWTPGCRVLICFLIVCWQVANLLLGVSHEWWKSHNKLVRQAAHCPAVYNRIVVEADLHTGRQTIHFTLLCTQLDAMQQQQQVTKTLP